MKIIMKKQRSAGAEMDPIRHSLAHLLAAAVLEKYPKAKLGIGPTIENGFYYDFLFPRPVTTEDLAGLEKRMRELARQDLPFRGKKVTPAEARKAFKDQPFKLDLIKEFVKEKKGLSIYRTGDVFQDLCRGGHVKSTREINPDAFKLTHLAGAYWRGDEKNPQLTRVYGLAFATKDELQKHLHMLEEAKRRDHRKLGADLDI
ncbi:MAG: Threonine-tRNA ligase [Parcubacteria group bacterium GW2011_GWA1_59_11]|nr:MAG: Threonine-tRNA ligase [Parcubacteria group bacterium GW2011_GWA1_59_11]